MESAEDSCICNNLAELNFLAEIKNSILIDKLRSVAEKTTCDICLLLHEMADAFEVDEESTITIYPPKGVKKTLGVWFLADMDEDDVMLSVFVPPGVESPHPHIRTLDPVAPHSDSEESLQLAARWLDDCTSKHEGCKSDPDAPMPTRVIDIGLDGKDPVLVETKGTTGRYAALSYCWGKKGQLKSTKETLPGFMQGIPMEELPRTARDAIKLCRHLKIPYLWIDALCIIQDDEDDWIRESSRMCDVYSSSTLTIAAARSRGSRGGIFGPQWFGSSERQNTFSFRGTQVYARMNPLDDHLGNPLAINVSGQESGLQAEKSWMLRPDELPLARRAWTVQERVLSRRVLYYTADELWWECDSCWACECGWANSSKEREDDEDGADVSFDPVQDANRGSFSWLRDLRHDEHLKLENAYKKWSSIVTLFSAGNLTFASDKLPALSGLAQQFQRALRARFDVSDDYLAGMWRQDLGQELLWIIGPYVGPARPGPHPREVGIPTWSWASVNGVISHAWEEQENGLHPLFRILTASVELATSDHTGGVRGGKLVVESRVTHGHALAGVPHPGQILASLELKPSGSSKSFYADCPGELDAEETYTCMAAAGGGTGGSEWFMVLRASRRVEGAYERVGLGVTFPMWESGPGLWDDAQTETITIV